MSRYLGAIRRHPSGVLLFGQLLAVLAWPFLDSSTAGRARIIRSISLFLRAFTAMAQAR